MSLGIHTLIISLKTLSILFLLFVVLRPFSVVCNNVGTRTWLPPKSKWVVVQRLYVQGGGSTKAHASLNCS